MAFKTTSGTFFSNASDRYAAIARGLSLNSLASVFLSDMGCPRADLGRLWLLSDSLISRTAYSCRTEFGESVRNALHQSTRSTRQLEGLNMKKLALALAATAVFAGQA